MIQMKYKKYIWILDGCKQQDTKKWFASYMLHVVLMITLWMRFFFCNANVSQFGKDMEVMFHTLYYKCCAKLHNHFYLFEQGNYTHQYMFVESIFSHTLYYKCCIKLRNIFLLSTRKLHSSIDASRVHPFPLSTVCHCFNTTELGNYNHRYMLVESIMVSTICVSLLSYDLPHIVFEMRMHFGHVPRDLLTMHTLP